MLKFHFMEVMEIHWILHFLNILRNLFVKKHLERIKLKYIYILNVEDVENQHQLIVIMMDVKLNLLINVNQLKDKEEKFVKDANMHYIVPENVNLKIGERYIDLIVYHLRLECMTRTIKKDIIVFYKILRL